MQRVTAADLLQRSLVMSDSQAAQPGVTYQVSIRTTTDSLLGSIRVELCANTSLPDDATCSAPNGFDASNAILTGQSGVTGFALAPGAGKNTFLLTRPPVLTSSSYATYTFTNITNPSMGGTYFARVYTYATSDGTGSYTDAGGLALNYRQSVGVSTEVPPYIRFCVGESISGYDCSTATDPFSNLGVLSPLTTGAAQSQLLVATNAVDGYTMWVMGGTMTSGNNTIPAMLDTTSQKGTSQFGINLRANTDPVIGQDPIGPGSAAVVSAYNTPNQFRFQSGDELATSATPDDNRKYTVSYVVNIDPSQPGGVYATTLTYVVLANF